MPATHPLSFEITDSLQGNPLPAADSLRILLERFKDASRTAAAKEFTTDLTVEEACAICMFAGVPHELDLRTGRIKFSPCALYKRNGEWTAAI